MAERKATAERASPGGASPGRRRRHGRRRRRRRTWRRLGVLLGLGLAACGATLVGIGLAGQSHAPQPTAAQAGSLRPTVKAASSAGASVNSSVNSSAAFSAGASAKTSADASAGGRSTSHGAGTLPGPGARPVPAHPKAAPVGPVLARSQPVSIAIPSIGVQAKLLEVGLNPDGTLQVPPLYQRPSRPAWYRYSPTPGELGPSVIVGHVDDYLGPAVFFRLGALVLGARIDVTLQDGVVAVFKVDGVRRYAKAAFPTKSVYGPTDFAALRLLTCGGPFDEQTRSYLDNVVVYASLLGSTRAPAVARPAVA